MLINAHRGAVDHLHIAGVRRADGGHECDPKPRLRASARTGCSRSSAARTPSAVPATAHPSAAPRKCRLERAVATAPATHHTQTGKGDAEQHEGSWFGDLGQTPNFATGGLGQKTPNFAAGGKTSHAAIGGASPMVSKLPCRVVASRLDYEMKFGSEEPAESGKTTRAFAIKLARGY